MQMLLTYCLNKLGAEQTYPFGPEPIVMKVGGKMFALITDDRISLKCDPVIAENLREQHAAITPGYHLNKKHWNTVHVDGSLPPDEITDMIDHSYELVLRSLSKAERNRILILQGS